ELAAALLAEPALRKVRAHRLAGRRVPEIALVERCRLLQQREEPLAVAALSVLTRRGVVIVERDAEAVGEPLDRAREVEVLGLLDERDEVAALAAAEAVVELVDRVDREARRPLLVERAAADEAPARLAQLRPRRDELDEVGGRLDRLDGGVLDPRHYSSS